MVQKSVDFVIIENVSKKFGNKTVLNNVSATIQTGKILGLIGKSAAGKSVLIMMLRGSEDYAPDSGRVLYRVNRCSECGNLDLPFEGTPCTKCGCETETITVDFWSLKDDDPLRRQLKGRIAIMLQRTFALFGDKTVIENIFEAIGDRAEGKARTDMALQLLEFVGMTHRTTHIARDLSGGEKQRIVLARQIARDPLFFLADEPTGTLDPYTAELMHERLVNYIDERGISMVFASHWPEAVDKMADEAIWLDSGEVVMQGKPKEITDKFMEGYTFERTRTANLGDPIISLKNAEKHFFSIIRGVVKAVDGITFDIMEREVFGLVGKSGAGKTTTSRMIAGMTPATEGSVKIRIGDDWVDMSEVGPSGKGRATPYIGFLHQEYTLYPFDNILSNLTTSIGTRMPAELAKFKAIQVLQSVGFDKKNMESLLYSYPDTLSVGECQRIAFAQVLIREPRIIILDEPTGTMDPITKTIIAKSVIRARETLGETFVVVSHDMDFVENVCDRVAFIRNGVVEDMGTPDSVIQRFGLKELQDDDFEGE
ncbi:MAG: methyl coenzyme M reductase system, component A2 [Candidatus Methanomethylophilaceae archaeon]|nr:methyl coenzyme reductase system, component [Candidatus Methanomethylophilaceae archaeon]